MEGGGSSQRDNSRGHELHTLVREGDKVKVEGLLQQPHSNQIVEYKLNGLTPLHVAALEGNAEIVEVLIKIGHADIHARSKEGDTPLHVAAKYGHEAVVEKLLQQQGAVSDIMAEDKRGDIPLHGAAQSGNLKIVKWMLSMAPNRQACIHARNGELRTPLHYAAGSGNVKVVDLLLDTKDQNLKEAGDELGTIPFHFAARSGNVKSLEKLIPSDINVASTNGCTALHYAAWNANVEAVKWLMEIKGASAKQKNAGEHTPLHLAAISKKPGSDKVAAIIVAKEPESWKMENSEGKLAIGIADECNHGHVVRAIMQSLRSKASHDDILTPTHKPNGATLLHYAAGYGTTEDIEWVMQKGKNMIESPDASSRTPLHWAAMKGNTSTLRALANAGADLIKVSSRAETPLFLALTEGHMEFAEELLKCDKERSKNAGSEGKCLTTEDWMRGVDQWMRVYYDDKVEKHVRHEMRSDFERHTRKQAAMWLSAGNGGSAYMFQEIPPLYLALHARRLDMAKFFQRLSSDEDAVNKKGPYTGRTALHWAILLQRRDIVEQLCSKIPEFSERMRVCEEDVYGIAPVQYATELNLQDIEAELLKRGSVKTYIDGLYRDRQIYVDSTNAILVCAALIASVTFAGWLQPPLNYVAYDGMGTYAAIKHKGMRVFWVFNSLSFFAAIGTVQAGACGVLPLRHVHIGRAVIYIRRALMIASLLMALSVVCVLGAFGAAGFVVLPPSPKYEIYMTATVAFGGVINAGLLLWFIYRVLIGPQLQRIWRHPSAFIHRASAPPNIQSASAPPDRTPGKESPTHSTEQKMPVFPWDDGIEELYARKPLNRASVLHVN